MEYAKFKDLVICINNGVSGYTRGCLYEIGIDVDDSLIYPSLFRNLNIGDTVEYNGGVYTLGKDEQDNIILINSEENKISLYKLYENQEYKNIRVLSI